MDIIIYKAGITRKEFLPGLLVTFDAGLDKPKIVHKNNYTTKTNLSKEEFKK
jgi:hypothetical protein